MQNQTSLLDIQSDLRRGHYASARSKCDSALKSLKGLDSVPILLARAEAIRSLPDSDLEMALKDVEDAISIDPKNPFCQLSLGQVFQALTTKSFDHGKSLCIGQEHASVLGRLDSLSTGTKNLLKSSESSSFNPIFLPREVLGLILSPLNPSQKTKCLRISRDWKNHLTSEANLWRTLEVIIKESSLAKFFKSSPLKLFALNSKDTLTSVHLSFDRAVSQGVVSSCFAYLKNSSRLLRSCG